MVSFTTKTAGYNLRAAKGIANVPFANTNQAHWRCNAVCAAVGADSVHKGTTGSRRASATKGSNIIAIPGVHSVARANSMAGATSAVIATTAADAVRYNSSKTPLSSKTSDIAQEL
jgi:hypothetical protein